MTLKKTMNLLTFLAISISSSAESSSVSISVPMTTAPLLQIVMSPVWGNGLYDEGVMGTVSAECEITGTLLTGINNALLSGDTVSITNSLEASYGTGFQPYALAGSFFKMTATNSTKNILIGSQRGIANVAKNIKVYIENGLPYKYTNCTYQVGVPGLNPVQIDNMSLSTSLVIIPVNTNQITLPSSELQTLLLTPIWTLGAGNIGSLPVAQTIDTTAINEALSSGTSVSIASQFKPNAAPATTSDFVVVAYNPSANTIIGSPQTFPAIMQSTNTWTGTTCTYKPVQYAEQTLNITANQVLTITPTTSAVPTPATPVAAQTLNLPSSTLSNIWISIISSTPAAQYNCKITGKLLSSIIAALSSGSSVTISPSFSTTTSDVIITAQEIVSNAITNPLGTQSFTAVPVGLTASSWSSSSATYQYKNAAGTIKTGPLVTLTPNQPLEIIPTATSPSQTITSLSINPVWANGKKWAKCPLTTLLTTINSALQSNPLSQTNYLCIIPSQSGSNFIVSASTYDTTTSSYTKIGGQTFTNIFPTGSTWSYSNFTGQYGTTSLNFNNSTASPLKYLAIYSNGTAKPYHA